MMLSKLWARALRKPAIGDADTSALMSELRASYLPLLLPHTGNPAELSETQVTDNENYMQLHLEERECAINALLRTQGVHWQESLKGVDHMPLVSDTRTWAKTHWPVLRAPIESLNIDQHWLYGHRDGDFIGLPVVSDTAILLGQCIVANRPSLHWGMDREPINKADCMSSTNRWVLLGKWQPDSAVTVVIEIEHVVLTLFVITVSLFETLNDIHGCLSGPRIGQISRIAGCSPPIYRQIPRHGKLAEYGSDLVCKSRPGERKIGKYADQVKPHWPGDFANDEVDRPDQSDKYDHSAAPLDHRYYSE